MSDASGSGPERNYHTEKADAAGAEIRKFLLAISAADLGLVTSVASAMPDKSSSQFILLSLLAAILALALVGISWFIQKHKHLKMGELSQDSYRQELRKEYRRYHWRSFTWDKFSALFMLSSALLILTQFTYDSHLWQIPKWAGFVILLLPAAVFLIRDIFIGPKARK